MTRNRSSASGSSGLSPETASARCTSFFAPSPTIAETSSIERAGAPYDSSISLVLSARSCRESISVPSKSKTIRGIQTSSSAQFILAPVTSPPVRTNRDSGDLSLDAAADLATRLDAELGRVIIGQAAVRREVLICLLAGGHCLLRGVPGLAKTLLIKTLAEAIRLKFNRIQFTPDLMPSDILGTDVIEEDTATGKRQIR